MKTKKLLSILLALMMMLSVVPMYASAADPIQLTEANIAVWPTFEGEMYYGQKLSEGNLTIQGGTVTTDGTTEGTVIEGYFEFVDLEYRPTALNNGASLRFVPKDSENYTGFETLESTKAIYKVLKTTPVLVDPINNPPVATKVSEAGKRLMTTTISGGALMNPYTKEVIEDAVWGWSKKTTKVNESGYFTATSTPVNYNTISMDIYVGIEGDTEETSVTVVPTFDGEIFYAPDLTWGDLDLTLVGGSAVIRSTNTPIDGIFTVAETMKDKQVEIGENTIDVKFTPADETLAMASTCQVSVTVNPAPIKFVDENGADIVPEITVPYGTKLGDRGDGAGFLLNSYINLSGVLYSINFVDSEGNAIDKETLVPVGTNEYKVKISTDNKNYENAELTCKFTVEATDVKVNILRTTKEILVSKANNTDPTPTGTFAIYVDGQLLKDGVKHNNPVEWNPTASKIYTIKAVYTPIENDPVNVEDVTITIPVALERKITYSGNIHGGNPSYLCGATVTLSANATAETFEGWVITDAAGNTVDLGVDLTATNITFTMPDYDITVEALNKNASSEGTGGIDDIFGGLDMDELTQGDSEWAIINIIRNIIAKFKSFLQQLIETFQSIGG